MWASSNYKHWLIATLGSAILLACNPGKQLERQDYRGGALGTSYAITVYTPEAENFLPAIDSVFKVVNQSMSTYIPDSDISRINQGDTTLRVDVMFREVFQQARAVYEASSGSFDPTVGILVDAWGFGPGEAMELDSLKVDSLLQYVGFEKVELLPDNRIRKKHPAIRFDFNAIAKGYAVDRIAAMLEAKGVPNFLVEVGGELRTRGENPEKNKAWSVGIDDPQVTEGRAIKQVIALDDRSMASSGNYRKFRVDPETGEKYVHTIDPRSGYTRNSNVLATSVVASSCMVADAYATAFMAMDLEASKELLEGDPELEGYIIFINASGETEEYMTSGFAALVR